METICFTIENLESVKDYEWFKLSKNLPITVHRAKSQVNNPRADKSDLALIVAVDKNQVVSYIGMIPDFLFVNNQQIKIAWGSTGWVHNNYKSTGIYVVLLLKALEFYKNQFAIAEVTDSAKRVFESSKKFIELKTLYSTTIVSRFCTEQYLINQNKNFKLIFPFLRLVDFIGNLIISPLYFLKTKNHKKFLTLLPIEKTDDEALSFMETYTGNNICRRTGKEIDWILQNPWVIEGSNKTEEYKKYFFSSISKKFKQGLYKLYKENKLIAVLLIKQRDNHISIPYSWHKEEDADDLMQAIVWFAYKSGAAKFTVFGDIQQNAAKRVKTIKLFSKKRERKTYITKKLNNIDFSKICLQSGDGDNVFT